MVLLVAAFIATAILIIERWLYYKSSTENIDPYLLILTERISKGDFDGARREVSFNRGPVSSILYACLEDISSIDDFSREQYEEVKSRTLAQWIPALDRYLNWLASLGSVSPFVGLLGTVLGIIRAFVSLSEKSTGGAEGLAGLNAGVAEALVTTAAGLFVAIPATIAYNYYRGRVDGILLDMEIAASKLKSILNRQSSGNA